MKKTIKENSFLMILLNSLGASRLAWACRRLHCPVPKSSLVLEVGSGGSPYFRSNVLIDAYENTRERHWVSLTADRPTIIGNGENLPFKDKAFDFVIASHVLEHSSDPERFLKELQRVSWAGYIETPDAFMERINPYWDHRLEVTIKDNELLIKKKKDWIQDFEIVELYENHAKKLFTKKIIPMNPFLFHVRFYWKNKIPFKIINSEVDACWIPPNYTSNNNLFSIRAMIGKIGLNLARKIFSQKKRNSNINLAELMKCIKCDGHFTRSENRLVCKNCHMSYVNDFGIFKPDL